MRLVYLMENEAMPVINYIGNKFFSMIFTWLFEQLMKDTLFGTKVLLKKDYERIKVGHAFFGDFDLLFGAAWLRLRIVEVPVRYRRRVAGYSKTGIEARLAAHTDEPHWPLEAKDPKMVSRVAEDYRFGPAMKHIHNASVDFCQRVGMGY